MRLKPVAIAVVRIVEALEDKVRAVIAVARMAEALDKVRAAVALELDPETAPRRAVCPIRTVAASAAVPALPRLSSQ